MDILNQMNTGRETGHRMNTAITVTGFIEDNNNPESCRILGRRVDTSEQVEVHVPLMNNINQPKISDLQQKVAIGGSIMLQGAFQNNNAHRLSNESEYVISCRWPRMLSPNQHEGRAIVGLARVSQPFVHDSGQVSMSLTVQQKEPTVIRTIEQLEKSFFFALDPENTVLNGHPQAGIRISEISSNKEILNSKIENFGPKYDEERKPCALQSTYNLYTTSGTKENTRYSKIRSLAEKALSSPEYLVEVVSLTKFPIGSQTRTAIYNKLEKGNAPSTWECTPTSLLNANEGEENYTGFTKCVIGLRRHRKGPVPYVSGVKALSDEALVSRSGLVSKTDLRERQEYEQKLSQSSNQQSTPQAPQAPQAPQMMGNFPNAEQHQTYAASTDFQQPASETMMPSSSTPVNHSVTTQPPTQSAPAPAPAPAQQAEITFSMVPVENTPDSFAVIPPGANHDLEESLFTHLSQHGNSNNSNGVWYFDAANYPQVRETLENSLHVLATQNTGYSTQISDTTNLQVAPHSPPATPPADSSTNLDMHDLGAEIDQMFSGSDSYPEMNR